MFTWAEPNGRESEASIVGLPGVHRYLEAVPGVEVLALTGRQGGPCRWNRGPCGGGRNAYAAGMSDRTRASCVEDVHRLAMAMPHVTVVGGTKDNPVYQVGGKSFVFFRNPRP